MNKPYKKGNVGKKKTIIKGDNGVQNKTKAFDGEKKKTPLLFIHERFSALISVDTAAI